MSLPDPRYEFGLDKLYTTKYYQTRDNFGATCPIFNSAQRPKKWAVVDADPLQDFIIFTALAVNLNTGQVLLNEKGKPYLKSYIMPVTVAISVNIPPNATNVPGADTPEWPVPCRGLADYEELVQGFGGVVLVRDNRFKPAEPALGGFTEEDRRMLVDVYNYVQECKDFNKRS